MTPPVAPKNATWLDIFFGKVSWEFGLGVSIELACARMVGLMSTPLEMGRIRGVVVLRSVGTRCDGLIESSAGLYAIYSSQGGLLSGDQHRQVVLASIFIHCCLSHVRARRHCIDSHDLQRRRNCWPNIQ